MTLRVFPLRRGGSVFRKLLLLSMAFPLPSCGEQRLVAGRQLSPPDAGRLCFLLGVLRLPLRRRRFLLPYPWPLHPPLQGARRLCLRVGKSLPNYCCLRLLWKLLPTLQLRPLPFARFRLARVMRRGEPLSPALPLAKPRLTLLGLPWIAPLPPPKRVPSPRCLLCVITWVAMSKLGPLVYLRLPLKK